MTITLHGAGKKLLVALGIGILAIALGLFLFFAGRGAVTPGVPGAANEERLRFLAACGWQVEAEPLAVNDITLPAKFSQVYENYSALNARAGFDLHAVAGQPCKQYCYRVTNYSGRDDVRATLLVREGHIVGGDIAAAALDGFMLPLREQESQAQPSAPLKNCAPLVAYHTLIAQTHKTGL